MARATYPYVQNVIAATPTQPESKAYRPQRVATITAPNGDSLRLFVLLDTGADACLLPMSMALLLGLDVLNLPKAYTTGVGSQANLTVYETMDFDLGDGITFRARTGFTSGLDAIGLGLLGQAGFFENYNVEFRHRDKTLTVESA